MSKYFATGLALGLVTGFIFGCGETVNYETREKLVVPGQLTEGSESSANAEVEAESAAGETVSGSAEQQDLCLSPAVLEKSEVLHFPEIPSGTTCAFASADNLSRKDAFIRAYLKQEQTITLPEGALLCGFSLDPTDKAMHYDDEMIFTVEDKILIATKDYTEYFTKDGMFYTFSWEALRNKVYNQFDQRSLYCVGGDQGLSECQLPLTDTSGPISLSFSAELSSRLAQVLQSKNTLRFAWITTGDNDDSDCRHTDLTLPIRIRYVPAEVKP